MNSDESLPTAAASLPLSESHADSSTGATETVNGSASTNGSHRADRKAQTRKRIQAQTEKKNSFLAGLLDSLDSIVYAELCILYYMDNSLFRLLIRAVNQLMFLTPKPAFIPPAPQYRPYLGAIFGPNILCILLHIFTARSEAGEATRGYLHGGVIVDLIGQKGPTSKLHLVLLDLLVWALQCVMLTAIMEKDKVTKALKELREGPRIEVSGTETRPQEIQTAPAQDVDAEEQGILRHGITDPGDIALGDIGSRNESSVGQERNEEHERLLAEPTSRSEEDENYNPLDMFYSNTALLATFHVIPALRTQWEDYGNASGSALQTVGFSAEFARVAATRRLNAEARNLQRPLNANQ